MNAPHARRLLRPLRPVRQMARTLATASLDLAVRGAGMVAAGSSRRPGPAAPPADLPSLFVLRNNDLGDLLVVTPLFDALRRRFPAAWIAAGVGGWNLPVLEHNPHLSEVLEIDAPWFNKYLAHQGPWHRLAYLTRSAQVRELARRRFAAGIDVLGSAWGSLLLLRAGIPYRMGVHGYAGGHGALQAAVPFDPGLHVGRAALRFAELLGVTDLPPCRPQLFLTPAEIEAGERFWAAAEADGRRRRRLVIGPGGGVEERCWPAESFVALAAGVAGEGGLAVLVLGGVRRGERELAAAVAAAAGGRSDSAPPALRELFGRLAACDLVVCNSSMLLHAAAAFAKPTLVLLGPAFPSAHAHQAQWGYPGTSLTLGREPGERGDVCPPAAALQAVREQLAALAGRS
jgi:heptosyltransferase-2